MATPALDADARTAPPLSDHHTTRGRYFENWIRRAAEDVAVTQVVVVPHRGPTWAYRIDWAPHIRLFEIYEEWDDGWEERLTATGYDPALPSAWLLETGTRRLLPKVGRLTAFGSQIAAVADGITDPPGRFRAHGFEVVTGPAGTVEGWRR